MKYVFDMGMLMPRSNVTDPWEIVKAFPHRVSLREVANLSSHLSVNVDCGGGGLNVITPHPSHGEWHY